jgi:hypothetical protein
MRAEQVVHVGAALFFSCLSVGFCQNPSPKSRATVDQVVRTIQAKPLLTGNQFETIRANLSENQLKCSDLPVSLALKLSVGERSRTAYLIHVANWSPNLLGTYQLIQDSWIAYKPVFKNSTCKLVMNTGTKENITNDPLLYGMKNVIFLGINQFSGLSDPNSVTLSYDVSATPDTPDVVQDLGSLLYALLGASLPTATTGGATGGGGPGGSNVVYVAGWRIPDTPRLPFFVNISLSAAMTQLGGLPDAQIGSPYSATVTASGGNGVFTYYVSDGALPSGLFLDSQSGAISGTPTSAAQTSQFTVLATDNSAIPNRQGIIARIKVNGSLIIDGTPALSNSNRYGTITSGNVGTAYSSTIIATGGTPPYQFSVASGSLPSGLSLNASTGSITGLPSVAGTSSLTFGVSDSSAVPVTVTSGTTTLEIAPTAPAIAPAPAFLVMALPPPPLRAQVGIPYVSSISVKNGTAPYQYGIVSGALPAGLVLNTSTGVIAGVPQSPTTGPIPIVFGVTDSAKPPNVWTTGPANVTVAATKIAVPLSGLPLLASTGTRYTVQIKDSTPGLGVMYSCPECASYGFSITADGFLSGKPTNSGVMTIVANGNGLDSALPIEIESLPCGGAGLACPPPDLTIAPRPFNIFSGSQLGDLPGLPYTVQIKDSTPNNSYSCPGCPPEVSVDASGLIKIDAASNTGEPYYFTLTDRDAAGTVAAIPIKIESIQPGLSLTLAAGAGNQSGGTPPNSAITTPPGGNTPASPKSQSPGGSKNASSSQQSQTNAAATSQTPSTQGVKCVVSAGSPCTFSRTIRDDDREFIDFSLGVAAPGPRERVYTNSTTSSLTRHADVLALVDFFPFFLISPKSGPAPHLVVGLPVSGSVFHRPVFGISETFTSWTKLERLGFPRMSIFGGVVYMQQQLPSATGVLVTDRALKPSFGIELSVSSLVSKIGSAAKSSTSKSKSGGGS